MVINDSSNDWSDGDPPVGAGLGDWLLLPLVDCCAQPNLELWAAKIVDVAEDSVDEGEEVELGLLSTVSKVFNSKLVDIARLSRLHLRRQDVI